MKVFAFSKRNDLEILRDPLNLFFGVGFPLILLILMTAIRKNIPVQMFEIEQLAPGIVIFGLSFMTLFSATLIAKDRGSSFLQRLYTTPLTAGGFILGYLLPILPICIAQSVICFAMAVLLGLTVTIHILTSVLFTLPVALLFVSLGLLCGSIFTDKQVGGICGALLTNLTAWLSGIWFDLELVGGAFKKIANLLPFVHAVEMERAVLQGDYVGVFPHLRWVMGYAAAVTAIAVFAFLRQMKRQ